MSRHHHGFARPHSRASILIDAVALLAMVAGLLAVWLALPA